MYDDKTKYGEQIPSMFSWISPEEQKRRAKKLEQTTEKNIKKDESNNKINQENRPG